MVKLVKLGDELRHACNMDVEMVSARCQDMKSRCEMIEAKLKMRLAALQKEAEKQRELLDVGQVLASLENELSVSSAVQLSERLHNEIKSKLDKCREANEAGDEELKRLEEVYEQVANRLAVKADQEKERTAQLIRLESELAEMDERMRNVERLLVDDAATASVAVESETGKYFKLKKSSKSVMTSVEKYSKTFFKTNIKYQYFEESKKKASLPIIHVKNT